MPVYNCEKHLHESISSILAQSFPNFEFIIINDGSTDKSEEIIRDKDHLYKHYYRAYEGLEDWKGAEDICMK